MIDELKELNDTFYNLFNDLKEARPALSGCDEAFLSIVKKITEQYELEYRLLDLKCRIGTEQEIAKLQERYERIVPQKWRTRFFHRKKENYAMTLVKLEVDKEAQEFFRRAEERLFGELPAPDEEDEEQTGEEWEIVEENEANEEAPKEAPEETTSSEADGDQSENVAEVDGEDEPVAASEEGE